MALVSEGLKTQAQEMLEFALGQKRICFGELSETEGDRLLESALKDVNLRELRGFKPLRNLLTFRPNSIIYGREQPHTLDVEVLDLSAEVDFSTQGFDEGSSITLDDYAISVCRGKTKGKVIFKRSETDEETSDYREASSWGRSAYHYKGSGEILAIRRPRNHTRANENLIVIEVQYEKVPHKNCHLITSIVLKPLSLGDDFRKHFGPLYPRIAVELIWELGSIYRNTSKELASQQCLIDRKVMELERVSEALSY